MFEGTEKRTITPLKDSVFNFNYYYLMGKNGQQNQALFPAANVLTRDVRVRPGNLFDGIVNLSCNCSCFTLDFGYNIFSKEGEAVSLKGIWEDDTYGIAATDYQTTGQIFTTDHTLSSKWINNSDLDINSITTPSYLTHKIYGALGYNLKVNNKFPVGLGFGASYEVGNSNHELEGYQFWAKALISF